jgi:hypothetical protein
VGILTPEIRATIVSPDLKIQTNATFHTLKEYAMKLRDYRY